MLTEAKKMAALAVFRTLYDNKKDIFTIISEFIKESINERNLIKVNTSLVASLLKEDYGFCIPEAVLDTVLKRIATKEKGEFFISDDIKKTERIDKSYNKIAESNNKIIYELIKYVEEKTLKALNEKEKGILNQSFCEFIITDDTNVAYSEYISAFIISNQGNQDFAMRLNTIKEGVVLYSGLLYNDNLNEIGSWNTPLTIYVEPEILFHLAGYNGELYKKLFDDFFELVKNVNSKSRNKTGNSLIKIKYFQEVKEEIDKFFKTAEHIKDSGEIFDSSKTAMVSILSGCLTPSDVLLKKAEFEALLKINNITSEEEINFYNEKENEKYNIESPELIKLLSETIPEDEIYPHLKYLYYINVLRKGEDIKQFEKARYILLTGNGRTMQMSLSQHIKKNASVPLATNLNFITSRLWFKLNKGFSDGNYPSSFNIINKAQIVISAQISNSVSEEFTKIKNKIANGDLSQVGALEALAELKSRIRNPEEIESENIESIVQSINDGDIERFLREREIERQRNRNTAIRNEELESNIKSLKNEQKLLIKKEEEYINYIEAQKDRYIHNLNKEKRKELEDTIIPYIDDIERKKKKAQKWITTLLNLSKAVIIFILLCITVAVIYFDYKYQINLINEYKYIELVIIWLLPIVYLIIKGKSFNLYKTIKHIDKNLSKKITRRTYAYYDIDESKLNQLYHKKEYIEQQLNMHSSVRNE